MRINIYFQSPITPDYDSVQHCQVPFEIDIEKPTVGHVKDAIRRFFKCDEFNLICTGKVREDEKQLLCNLELENDTPIYVMVRLKADNIPNEVRIKSDHSIQASYASGAVTHLAPPAKNSNKVLKKYADTTENSVNHFCCLSFLLNHPGRLSAGLFALALVLAAGAIAMASCGTVPIVLGTLSVISAVAATFFCCKHNQIKDEEDLNHFAKDGMGNHNH